MEGGTDVNEDDSMEDDGSRFFCKLHYDTNLARFEDLHTVSMPEEMRNQPCPLFCPVCTLSKNKETVRATERVCVCERERERE